MSLSVAALNADGSSWCHDGILLQHLNLQHAQHVGTDAWGRAKEQPILLSVAVSFKKPFSSAASNDALDDSTIHYGQLAKSLRGLSASTTWETLESFAARLQDRMTVLAGSQDLLESCRVLIHLPKASLLGKGVNFLRLADFSKPGETAITQMIHLDAINVPVLVGVNANERARKQPLLFHLYITSVTGNSAEKYADLEARLVEVSIYSHQYPRFIPASTKQTPR